MMIIMKFGKKINRSTEYGINISKDVITIVNNIPLLKNKLDNHTAF